MKITKTIKTAEGPVTFSGELTEQEFDFVLEVGLSYLMAQGAIPFKALNDGENIVVAGDPEVVH